MSIKTWVTAGIIYVVGVFTVFTLITGQNPFESGGMEHDGHSEMNHDAHEITHSAADMSSDGQVPEGLSKAANPAYETGSEVIINADHMPGMDGAEAVVSGAYDTTVYSVSYTDADGNEITDHKWVIHEELENPELPALEAGTEVVLNADHMEGMNNAAAEIDTAVDTTVYMVDFKTTDTNEHVQNHKWVTEEELSHID